MSRTALPRRRPRRGFTLIELLAVMTILAILASVAVVGIGKFQRRSEEQVVEALFVHLTTLVEGEVQTQTGDFPPDNYAGLAAVPPNDLNTGIESLVAFLSRPGVPWPSLDEKNLGNTDGDQFPKKVTRYGTQDAFELVDYWGNPLVYIHCRSYGKKQKAWCRVRSSGAWEEQVVEAVRDPKTQEYYRQESFQLLSAGRDGVFGTGDDLANFQRP
jgi:prepilin-type N-terminal cleavage/methylation domain-containing protein